MRHVVCCVGTRPEAIKMAPLVLALRGSSLVRCTVVATAQHRGLLDEHLALFGIRPDLDLDLMAEGQPLADLHGRLVSRIAWALRRFAPDLVVAHGDTATVLCTALACFYEGIPFGHLEGGLRTGRIRSPFPEEMNRRLVAPLAAVHFAPTASTRDNLLAEGVAPEAVHVTGNTGIDALLAVLARDPAPPPGLDPCRRLVVVTAHRRETLGAPLREVCGALRELAETESGLQLLMPVHPNPEVAGPVREILDGCPGAILTGPLSYPEMVAALRLAVLILTDSGGLQEEGPALGVPVLVLRDETERPEGVALGVARLVGRRRAGIVGAARELLRDESARGRMARTVLPYGDGHAAERIRAILEAPSSSPSRRLEG